MLSQAKPDEKYRHVASFMGAHLIQNSHHANMFLSNQSLLLLRDMVWVYDPAAEIRKNDLATDLADV